MSPLFTLLGKLLVQNNTLASSLSCCCGGCSCPDTPYGIFCSCMDITISFSSASASVKLGSFPSSTGTINIPEQANGDIPSSTLTYSCTTDGPDGKKGWAFTYTMSGRSETWQLFIGDTPDIVQDIINVNGKCCPVFDPCNFAIPRTMAPDMVLEDTPIINLSFTETCTICDDPEVKCLPIVWQLYDTTNGEVLDTGPIVSTNPEDPYATDYILQSLEDQFIPWGYYTKTFDVALIIFCENENIGETIWTQKDVQIGKCGGVRYPTYAYDAPWTRKICIPSDVADPCIATGTILTINMRPGGKTRSGYVTTYINNIDLVDNHDYSNIFHWADGTYNKYLPDSDTNVTILTQCLEDGSQNAKCKKLTINGNFNFGIKINASNDVFITGGAHIIDQRYNTVCNGAIGRGHIICSSSNDGLYNNLLSDGNYYRSYGAIISDGNNWITGTLEYTGPSDLAATFHASNIGDEANIIGGDYVMLFNTDITAYSHPLASNPAQPVYNGKWIMEVGSENYGILTTPQFVRFFQNASNRKTVTTTAPVYFYDNSSNNDDTCTDKAVITNDAIFHNTAFNSGKVGGNVEFYDDSYYVCGTITGCIDFYDTSYVKAGATLGSNCLEFWNSAYNDGTINGCPIFHADSYNNTGGIITVPGGINAPNNCPKFFNNAYNSGTINGSPQFNNYAQNRYIISGKNCEFNNYSYNRGVITVTTLCTFNNDATNEYAAIAGTTLITGNCAFNGGRNYGKINGDCTFTLGALTDSSNTSIGPGSFITGNCTFDASTNGGRIDGNVVFSANSKNKGVFARINLPSNGSCVFNNSSHEDDAVIYGDDATETVTFNGTSVCDSYVFAATTLNGTSTNSANGKIYPTIGNITLNSGTTNNGSMRVNGNATVTLNSAINNNKIVALGGNTCIFNNSTNSATGNIGLNLGGPTTVPFTTMSFTNNSSNYGTVTGDADFDSTSCNSGTVTGTITGSPPACP